MWVFASLILPFDVEHIIERRCPSLCNSYNCNLVIHKLQFKSTILLCLKIINLDYTQIIHPTRENLADSDLVMIPYLKVVNRRLNTLYGIITVSLSAYFSRTFNNNDDTFSYFDLRLLCIFVLILSYIYNASKLLICKSHILFSYFCVSIGIF